VQFDRRRGLRRSSLRSASRLPRAYPDCRGWRFGTSGTQYERGNKRARNGRLLVVIEAFGTAAELIALQLLDDEVEALDLGVRLAERGALGCASTPRGAHDSSWRLHLPFSSAISFSLFANRERQPDRLYGPHEKCARDGRFRFCR
jgi:hypothetical protein